MLTLTADADIISGMDILILDAIGANIFKNISTFKPFLSPYHSTFIST